MAYRLLHSPVIGSLNAQVMAPLKHQNLVNMLGAGWEDGPVPAGAF